MSSAVAHRSGAISRKPTASTIARMASSLEPTFLYSSVKLGRDQSVLACGCATHRRLHGLEATASSGSPSSDNPVDRRDTSEPPVPPGGGSLGSHSVSSGERILGQDRDSTTAIPERSTPPTPPVVAGKEQARASGDSEKLAARRLVRPPAANVRVGVDD
jgi:hypothetical protein